MLSNDCKSPVALDLCNNRTCLPGVSSGTCTLVLAKNAEWEFTTGYGEAHKNMDPN